MGIISERAHLCVQEGIAQKQLLAFEILDFFLIGELGPLGGLGAETSLDQARLEGGQLVDEGGTHLELGAARVEELERLEKGPAVSGW